MTATNGNQHDHVVVVLVNFNGLDDTVDCLNSLAQHCDPGLFSVVLIDNASATPPDRLRSMSFPFRLEIVCNAVNEGFAAACNTGIDAALAAQARFVLLLNNDTVLVDDVIAALKGLLDADLRLGIVGAVNYYHASPGEVWVAGIRADFAADRYRPVTAFNPQGKSAIGVDWVPGSSLMVRTTLLREIGGLDANYFAYWEEADLCLRARRKGSEVAFGEGTRILHKVGRSSPSALKEYLRTRNRLYFYHKNFSSARFLRAGLSVVTKALLRAGFHALRREPRLAFAYLAGIADFALGRMGAARVAAFLKH